MVMEEKTKIHFGCGSYRLDGWINVDLDRSGRPDVVADLRENIPFQSRSVDYIHSEDFVDQLELDKAYHFFEESHRILKDDGVMRVLTPNLYEFARRYVKQDRSLVRLWDEQIGLPLRTRRMCEIFNLGMRLGGHTFLYDGETLCQVLRECGFEPQRTRYRQSRHEALRGLDIRSPKTGVSLYYDCYKAKKIGRNNSLPLIDRIRSLKTLLPW